LSNLYNYYTKIFQIHSLNESSSIEISQKIGVNPFFVNDFKNASMNINMKETVKILDIIKGYDLKSKGISTITENNRILTQLALEILG
jgi:DNA polymerase-3 subunit delta